MRDRNLTGLWAGFSFKAGRLVTPEGRELEPQDLAWLSLLAAQAQEWRRMMEIARGGQKRPFGRAGIVDLAELDGIGMETLTGVELDQDFTRSGRQLADRRRVGARVRKHALRWRAAAN